ncbi:hypothetical protein JYU34_016037 [Plutella xylostella]|uniref:Thioesterase domain-containing protein n=1 Tax=Plutella xylostella TaxID=51655 RepID=A0ABQ7Q5G6_PLUXY|nr:hypothetical protein JYU34_016037 [Plutella xylostella]
MASSSRGLRLIKAIEIYTKSRPNQWDTSTVFNKVKILSANEGQLRASFTVDSSMCNPLDTLHGGYVSTVVDVLSMFGQMSHAQGKIAWTTNMNVVYLNAAFKGDQITVSTAPLTIGRTLSMETTLVNDQSGAVVAKGTTMFLQGGDKFQTGAKDILGFDVYEN